MAKKNGNTYNFKIVLLGEGCVGKTSLVLRYVEDTFNSNHITTLQVIAEFRFQISFFSKGYVFSANQNRLHR